MQTPKNKVLDVNKYIVIHASFAISNQGLQSNNNLNKSLESKPYSATNQYSPFEDTWHQAQRNLSPKPH